MVGMETALSWALTIIGAFVFIILKFFMAKMFKGWKGWIAKAVVAFVLAGLSGVVWAFCPAASVILVFSIMIVSGLVGYFMILAAQNLPFVGPTIMFAFSIIAPAITIWIILMVIEFILNLALTILEIVLLFVPGVGWAVDVALLAVGILIPIIFPLLQMAVAWAAFTSAWSGLAGCILGMGRTGPIPGTGGISIGAAK